MAKPPVFTLAPSSTGKKIVADNPAVPGTGAEWRRWLYRLGFREGSHVSTFTLEGSDASATATSISLAIGGGEALAVGSVGVPVAAAMSAKDVAVTFLAGAVPAGDWTLTLYKSEGGGSYASAATFTITHS